jgi:hypothetical protein
MGRPQAETPSLSRCVILACALRALRRNTSELPERTQVTTVSPPHRTLVTVAVGGNVREDEPRW